MEVVYILEQVQSGKQNFEGKRISKFLKQAIMSISSEMLITMPNEMVNITVLTFNFQILSGKKVWEKKI